MDSTSTRRTFVGSALAGAALMAPVALVTPRRPESIGSECGDASAPPQVAMEREASHWTAAIGRRFRLSSDDGAAYATLTHVVAGEPGRVGAVPVRRQSFHVRFALEGNRAIGDAIYALDRPIAGSRALFMTHGRDAAGRAVLSAVFG